MGPHLSDRMALLAPSAVAGLVTFLWFPWNRFLAAGDITPFIRDGDGSELFDLWNHRVTGAGATSASATRALEVILIRATRLFGGSEVVAQHLFYAFVMAFAAFGAAYLARAFVRDPIAVGAAGLLGSFNVYVLIHLPNPLTMVWLGLVGTCCGMVLRVARGAPLSVAAFAGVTLVASYVSLNPPLLATATLTVLSVACAASWLVGPGGARRAWKFLGRATPWVIGMNLWWLVPTVLATGARQGLGISAVTRVEDWSWSQARNSIPNLLSFTAHWGWIYPQYMPFARSLDAYPWSLMRWALPMLAGSALLLVHGRRRIAAWTLVGAIVGAGFLAKGLHWPLASVNLWAYHHVPGLWLLRDPFSKVGGILLLSMVVLAAMTIEMIRTRAKQAARCGSSRKASIAVAGLVVAVCSALAFPYPLWLGTIGPDGHGTSGLPSIRVAVPTSWHDLANALNASAKPGKAIVLPLDPYYQVTTNWGFHGADTLPAELLDRPVLSLLPGGYLTPAGLLPDMLLAVERDLVLGRSDRAAKLLQVLGVSYVILRRDLVVGQVVRSVAARGALAKGLSTMAGLGQPKNFGVADVYSVSSPTGLVWTATRVTGLVRRDNTRTVDAMSALPTRGVAVDPASTAIDDLSWEAPDQAKASTDFELRRGGTYAVGLAGATAKRYRLSVVQRVVEGVSTPMLRISDPVTMRVDGVVVDVAPAQYIPMRSANVVAVALDGRVVTDRGRMELDIVKPSRVETFTTAKADASTGDRFSPVGDCAAKDPTSTPPTATRIPGGRRLTAATGVACMTFPGPALSPNALYRVKFDSRGSSETAVRACLWMHGPDTCTPMRPVAASRGWSTFDVAVHTQPGTTGLTLYMYADTSYEPAGTAAVAEYRNVSLTPLDAIGRGTIVPALRGRATQELARGAHHVTLDHLVTSTPIVANSPLADCNHIDDRTHEEAGMAVASIDGGVQLRADAHAACVTARLPAAMGMAGRDVAITLDVRTVRGKSARVCLWQFGPNQCAVIPPLPSGPAWHTYRAEVRLAHKTTSTRLFVYADGASTGTETEYRNLTAEMVTPEIVDVHPVSGTGATPSVRREKNSAGASSAELVATGAGSAPGASGADYPAFVVLNESFSPGWELAGAKVLRHTEVNGYANGWAVASGGSIAMRYGPSSYATMAVFVSVGVLLLALGLGLYRRRRRTRASHAAALQAAGSTRWGEPY